MSDDLAAGVTCYTTDCNAACKKGTNQVAQMNGQPNQLSTNNRCNKGEYHNLCCADGTRMGTCQWRGYRGVALSCMGGCDDGETEVVQDTNSFDKTNGDRTCTGGTQSYCCKGFKPAPSGSDLKDQAEDAAKAAAEAAAEQAALDIAAKAFCRVAVPALLAPLELIEDAIPIIGEILDIVEIAATPALIQACVKGIEKEGKAEFKVFGKKHSLTLDKPTTPKETRPPTSSHSSAKTSSCSKAANAKRADNGNYCDPKFNKVVTTEVVDDFGLVANPIGQINCNPGNVYPQACQNYRSISQNNAAFHTLTCPFTRLPPGKTERPISELWAEQHKTALWDALIAVKPAGGCSPDEYPPAVMADVNDGYSLLTSTTQMLPRNPPYNDRGQRIRYIASNDNKEAGRLFDKCGQGPRFSRDNSLESTERNRRAETTWTKVRAVYTRKRFTVDFNGLPNNPDDGIPANPCAPTFQVNGVNAIHPGYQLLNTDGWFTNNAAEQALTPGYASSPTKRDWIEGRGLVLVGQNSSRVATPEELREELGFDECADDKCTRELEALKKVIGAVKEEVSPTVPVAIGAEATLVNASDDDGARNEASMPGSNFVEPDFPRETGRAG